MIDSRNRAPKDPDEAAAWWFARISLHGLSAESQSALDSWLSHDVHRSAWDAVNNGMAKISDYAAMPDIMHLRAEALSMVQQPPRRKGVLRLLIGAAALASAACTAGIMWLGMHQSEQQPAAVVQRYATTVGERRAVRLIDGSVVTLNTDTAMEVSFGAKRREVRLLRGQAWFDVAKNPEKPFDVFAADKRITALGTAFDVRLDRYSMSVLLAEGSVAVDPLRREGLSRLIPDIDRTVLRPGERLTATGAGGVQVEVGDVDQDRSWREGRLVFRDEPLSSAVQEMNRFWTDKLIVEDERIARLPLSGVFSTSDPQGFDAAVTAFYPLRIIRKGKGLRILIWAETPEA